MPPGSLADAAEANSLSAAATDPAGAGLAVCHIASGDLWAGAEAQLAALLQGLARRGSLRLSAIFFNEGRLADSARRCGVAVHVFPESRMGFFALARAAVRHLRGQGAEILHSHGYKSNLLAALVARRCGIPFLVRTQHGLPEPFAGLRQARYSALQLLDRGLARWGTDRVIAVSYELATRLARSIPAENIVTIPNGLDRAPVRSALTQAQAKRRLGVPEDCSVIGTAGRLEPIKRLDIFLAAAAQIARRSPNVRFIVAGEGGEKARLQDQARALGLADRVLFLGHRDDAYDVLRAYDLLVFSSDHEGLPMVLLEAICLGVPVVARGVGGIREVIHDGVHGRLVSSAAPEALAEACLEALANPQQREQMARNAAGRLAAQFDADATAAEVATLYQILHESRTADA